MAGKWVTIVKSQLSAGPERMLGRRNTPALDGCPRVNDWLLTTREVIQVSAALRKCCAVMKR